MLLKQHRKKWIVMRNTILIILISTFQVLASGSYAQTKRLNLDMKNTTIKEVLSAIEDQSEFYFLYNSELIDVAKKVDVEIEGEKVDQILARLFNKEEVDFLIKDRYIVLTPVGGNAELFAVQQPAITGTVTDESGDPLPGVTVIVKGTTQGTVTNSDGEYTLRDIPEDATLQFSFVGMKTQEVVAGNQTIIDIQMMMDAIGLEEVVAVGYGTQKKMHLTGAIGTMKAEDLEKRTVTDVRHALQGNIPGLTIIDRGGPPGSEYLDFKIRGVGTIGNAQPLVLIDGVQRGLETLDSDDIESISVLKDASSAAIYGSRASNGVILIETKRAKKDELIIELDGRYGIQTPALRQEFLNAREYLELINESFVNAGQSSLYSQDYINRTVYRDNPDYPYTDGWNELIGLGQTHDYSFRIMNGGEKTNTYFSVNYVNQNGILQKATNERYIVTFNNTFNINERLKLSADIAFSYKNYSQPLDYGIGWALGDPIVTFKYPNGLYGFSTKNGVSPLAHLEKSGVRDQFVLDGTSQLKMNYEVIDGLNIEGFAGYIYRPTKRSEFKPYVEFPDPNNPDDILLTWQPSFVRENRGEVNEQTYRLKVDYEKYFDKHNIGLLGGYEQIQNQWTGIDAYRERIYNNNFRQLSLGDPATSTNSGGAADWALMSYFGRTKYNFDEKYFFEANLRYDGSSRFAKGNKWGLFPALSAGWIISKESFMESLEGINVLKLRGSYGTLGNQNIGLFRYLSRVSSGWDYTFAGELVPGYNIGNYANEDITWESTTTLNLGLDFSYSLNNSIIDATFDWYIKNTDDILLTLPIPRIVGLWASETNAGKVKNEGWEISLSYRNYSSELGYAINFNLSDVKNEVVDLAGLSPIIDNFRILKEGHPIWSSYGWQSNGLFEDQADIDSSPRQPNSANIKPGDIKFVDRDGNGVINDEDRYVMGSNIPRYTFGLNTEFSYKNFDLTAFFQGALKSEVYLKGSVNDGPSFQNAATIRFRDRWTPENPDPNASMPRITANQNYNNIYNNDFWLRDAKYVRLKNLQIGYNIPESLVKMIGLSSIRMFIAGTNLLTITPLEAGLDPEIDNGWSAAGYPTLSTYSIGLSVKL